MLPLFPRVVRALIYHVIELGAEVIEFSVVTKSPPLHIDTHATFTLVNQVDILHFLHVAGVGPCAWKIKDAASMQEKGWQLVSNSFLPISQWNDSSNYEVLTSERSTLASLYDCYCRGGLTHRFFTKYVQIRTRITRAERRPFVAFAQKVTAFNQSVNRYLYKRSKSWWTFRDEQTASSAGKLCLRSRTSSHVSRPGHQPPDAISMFSHCSSGL